MSIEIPLEDCGLMFSQSMTMVFCLGNVGIINTFENFIKGELEVMLELIAENHDINWVLHEMIIMNHLCSGGGLGFILDLDSASSTSEQ